MKKHLLFGLSVGICISAAAQTKFHAVKQNTQNGISKIEGPASNFHNPATKKPAKRNSSQVLTTTRIKFSSSYNANSVLVGESNCLTADQTTKTVSFTHRVSQDWNAPGVNSGFIQTSFTNNDGTTWDSILDVQDQVNLCRYPSGALFNPTGNIATTGLYSIVAGPITNGSNWVGNFFASSQLNNTNRNVNIMLNATSGVKPQHFVRIGMQTAGNKVIVTGSLYANPDGTTAVSQAYRGASVNIGTFDGTSNFTWANDSIKPNFLPDPADGTNQTFSIAQTAWSPDGTVGYVIFCGVDSLATGAELAYQPLVWKTINGGTTWAQMPLYDFSGIPSINEKLIPTTSGSKKAWYSQSSGIDAVVDVNNNLHIVNIINSASSDALDSLGYTWTPNSKITYIYDTYTTSTGWDAILVDSLLCITADAQSPFSGGTPISQYTIDARIQASRTTDGTHLFYFWIDSDPAALDGENAAPDIKAKGLNITNGFLTPTTTFTDDGINYYLYASNIALVNGSTYSIGATTSNSRDGSGNADITFDHFYISGIQFVESDFTNSIIEKDNIASISQNYPNPFSKSTSIDISLNEAASVSVEVYNTIGQKVIIKAAEKLNTGPHTLTIDCAKLKSGIYFYTVKAGDNAVTRKMVIQ